MKPTFVDSRASEQRVVKNFKLADVSSPPSALTALTRAPLAETTGLADFHPVEMLQDQAQCILGDYVRSRHPRQPTRFGRLLLAIPLLRMIRPSTVENFFFRDTVGDASVIRLLQDMYHADSAAAAAAAAVKVAADSTPVISAVP